MHIYCFIYCSLTIQNSDDHRLHYSDSLGDLSIFYIRINNNRNTDSCIHCRRFNNRMDHVSEFRSFCLHLKDYDFQRKISEHIRCWRGCTDDLTIYIDVNRDYRTAEENEIEKSEQEHKIDIIDKICLQIPNALKFKWSIQFVRE